MTGARPHWRRDLLAPSPALPREWGRELAPACAADTPRAMAADDRIRISSIHRSGQGLP